MSDERGDEILDDEWHYLIASAPLMEWHGSR